jgi:hypothetical protein
MRHEIKVEFPNNEVLSSLIKKAYFEEGSMGKIIKKDFFIPVTEESDVVLHTIFKGLNNATVKILNPEVIDGAMRFLIDETSGEVRIYPISIYCIKENDKYIFY